MYTAASVAILLLAFTASSKAFTQCIYNETVCGCNTENGTISLNRYRDQSLHAFDPVTANTYIWNPCKDITVGQVTASCVQTVRSARSESYDCGVHSTISTSVTKYGHAYFRLDSANIVRHSIIVCLCKLHAKDVLAFEEEDPTFKGTYRLALSGDSCCPK